MSHAGRSRSAEYSRKPAVPCLSGQDEPIFATRGRTGVAEVSRAGLALRGLPVGVCRKSFAPRSYRAPEGTFVRCDETTTTAGIGMHGVGNITLKRGVIHAIGELFVQHVAR